MLTSIVYIAAVLLELTFLIMFSVYTLSMLYSSTKGSPYVPTKNKLIEQILEFVNLKKGDTLIELGCGDARLVRYAVEKYGVKGIGIDVNPLLIKWARFLARIKGLKNIELRTENMFQTSLKESDVLYLFLMPKLIQKMRQKMEKELKKKSIVISHGFKIEGWENKLIHTLHNKPFETFYYEL